MKMRDLQSPAGVWFPTGQDQHGSENWAIKVPAKVVKDEVKWQLGRWKAEHGMAKAALNTAWDEYFQAKKVCVSPSKEFLEEWRPRKDQLERDVADALPRMEFWKRWDAYLEHAQDDQLFSLTRSDYETFLADRDQREGVGE